MLTQISEHSHYNILNLKRPLRLSRLIHAGI